MTAMSPLEMVVSEGEAGIRLDSWITMRLTGISRTRIQALIKKGRVLIEGKPGKESRRTRAGETVRVFFPVLQSVKISPEPIPLDILHQDADIVAVNKPAGLAVHPSIGHPRGTLANALLHHCPDLAGIGWELRPGMAHRLDKDTSGVLVAAKNEKALASLLDQFKKRLVHKEYLAIALGRPEPAKGVIRTLIGRDPASRMRMSARVSRGRAAVTNYRVLDASGGFSLILLTPETGRTHQLRVHLAHAGHPVAGDARYGADFRRDTPAEVPRQMLHAWKLALTHPGTGRRIEFVAPIPRDMSEFMRALGMKSPR